MGEESNYSLIKIEGKPLEKLIEVVSQGIGALYRPTAIRKEAKAKAFELEVLSKAQATANAEGKLIELETFNIIEQKFLYQQVKKQSNIDKIVDVAFDQVNQEPEVSAEKVDPDWTTRFFNIAEDVSNDEMQQLWGRILSGEIKQPGSFSLRTLEALKNLTKEEAEIFTKFAQLKVRTTLDNFIPYTDRNFLEKELQITYKDILLMSELGLIINNINHGLIFNSSEKNTTSLFEYGEFGILVKTQSNNHQRTMLILTFTKIGLELSQLISQEPNLKYIEYVCKSLAMPHTKIFYGKRLVVDGKHILKDAIEYQIQHNDYD